MNEPLRLSADVRFRAVGSECVVVDQTNSTVAVVNTVGGRILEQIRDGCDHSSLVETLVDDYRLSPEQARRDVDAYLAAIEHQGWLVGFTGSTAAAGD